MKMLWSWCERVSGQHVCSYISQTLHLLIMCMNCYDLLSLNMFVRITGVICDGLGSIRLKCIKYEKNVYSKCCILLA